MIGRTVLAEARDAAPPPAADADLPTISRWSISTVFHRPHLLGRDDFGHVVSVDVDAFGSDGTWARRPDGSYLRLRDAWLLPLAPTGVAR